MPYIRFAILIAGSTLLMYVLIYLNTFAFEHVRFSQTRLWMALIMTSAMAVVMLLGMGKMYANRRLNIAILIVAGATFLVSLGLVPVRPPSETSPT